MKMVFSRMTVKSSTLPEIGFKSYLSFERKLPFSIVPSHQRELTWTLEFLEAYFSALNASSILSSLMRGFLPFEQ